MRGRPSLRRACGHFASDPCPAASFFSLEPEARDGVVPYFFTRTRPGVSDPLERRLAWHATDAFTPLFPDLPAVLEMDPYPWVPV